MKCGFFYADRRASAWKREGIGLIIERIINNNVISALEEDGSEIIVMGKGIGFGKKKGSRITDGSVEKIFRMENEELLGRFKDLLAGLPLEYIQVSNEVISRAKEALGVELNQNVYITLTDHISFAIERFKEGMLFRNALHNEIRRFYPVEYAVGQKALALIEEKTKISLPADEAASIALHLVNAEYNMRVRDTWVMTEMIRRMAEIIAAYVPALAEDSLDRDRILANLKFLAYRILLIKPVKETGDEALTAFIRKNCPKDWKITEEIIVLLREEYDCGITEEEQLYLAISIKRIRDLYPDSGKGE